MSTDVDTPEPVASTSAQQPLPPTTRQLDLLPPRITKQAQSAVTPDPAGPDDDLPQSQPMTATHSNSSQNDAGTYGTRSRHRKPRINYADDKDLDAGECNSDFYRVVHVY